MLKRLLNGLRGRVRRRLHFSDDEAIASALSRFKTGVMLDVGAHVGSWHWLADRRWTIYAYEPDPENRKRIPPRPSVIVSPQAVGEAPGMATLYASAESTGISSLTPFTGGHRPRCEVAVTTLATEIDRFGLTQCDFLKIDTEGHDLFVLRGFPWGRVTPRVILAEFEDRKTQPLGYSYRELGDFLLMRGYTVYLSEWFPIVRYGTTHRWRRVARYPTPTHDPGAWGNFLAFRDEADVPRMVKRHAS